MEALVIHAAGDLRVEQLDTPELAPHQLQVRVRCGGICGSDLHYYQDGGFGTVRVKEPMVLGHEVAGRDQRRRCRVPGFTPGERIAISPSRPCGLCRSARWACTTIAWTCATTAVRCARRTCKAPSGRRS